MTALLAEFSVAQIITFIVLGAAAIKGFVTFFDWAGLRMSQKVHKEERSDDLERKLDIMEETHCKHIDALKEKDSELQEQLANLTDKIDLLIASDRDDIKAWITNQYHIFMKQGFIDDYSLDCLERRYEHYEAERGNSFISTLMKELRALPKKN